MQERNEIHMRVSYNKLWKLLIYKNIKKGLKGKKIIEYACG